MSVPIIFGLRSFQLHFPKKKRKKAVQPRAHLSLCFVSLMIFCNMQSNPHLINHLGLARQTYFLRSTIQLFYNDLGPRSHQIHSKSHGKIYPIKCLFEVFFHETSFCSNLLLFFFNKRNNVIFGNTWLHHDKIFNIFVEKPSFSSNIYFSE